MGTLAKREERASARILLVEDDRDTTDLLRQFLERNGYSVVTASGGSHALAYLQASAVDLVLSDVSMAEGDGLELVSKLRRSGQRDVPVILMSGSHETERRVLSLDLGADDFVPKPIELDELLARLRSQLRRAERQAELLRESLLDPLTQVLNRRGFAELSASHFALLRRRTGSLSLLMIDLDDFKLVNDQHGHSAGDAVLVEVSGALVRSVRASDRVGRLGGDEFAILLPEASKEVAHALMARLRALSPLNVQVGPTQRISAAFSMGVATAGPDESFSQLLARADAAMYEDKRSGAAKIRAVQTTRAHR